MLGEDFVGMTPRSEGRRPQKMSAFSLIYMGEVFAAFLLQMASNHAQNAHNIHVYDTVN